MKGPAGIALTIVALAAAYGGLWAWVRSGNAPRFVTVPYDRVSAILGRDYHTRCYLPDTVESGIKLSRFLTDRDCLDWQAPREFAGIFINEFEGQRFLEGLRPSSSFCQKDDVWLDFDQKSDLRKTPQLDPLADTGARIWSVRFMGMKTDRLGNYGHLRIERTSHSRPNAFRASVGTLSRICS